MSKQCLPKYSTSRYKGLVEASKNTFYRFKNSSEVSWRAILYNVVGKLNAQINKHSTPDKDSARCLIIDDTDLAKTGKHIEHAGKIWSHTIQRSILGCKGLFRGLLDSKSFMALDFSHLRQRGRIARSHLV